MNILTKVVTLKGNKRYKVEVTFSDDSKSKFVFNTKEELRAFERKARKVQELSDKTYELYEEQDCT